MTRILVVNSSPNPDTSVSRGLTARFIDGLVDAGETVDMHYRDIGRTPPPHLDQATIGAIFTPPADRSDSQKSLIAYSDELVAEVEAADVIVIGSPMQNFGITSGLKAWLDHIARVGVTFRYTENGPEGLLGGRKVYVMTASGGDYTDGSPMAALNHQVPHLKTVLGFLGLDDVTVIQAPATAKGDDGVKAARAAIDKTVTSFDADVRNAA